MCDDKEVELILDNYYISFIGDCNIELKAYK